MKEFNEIADHWKGVQRDHQSVVGCRQANYGANSMCLPPAGENSVREGGKRGGQGRSGAQEVAAAPQPIPGGNTGSRQASDAANSNVRAPAGEKSVLDDGGRGGQWHCETQGSVAAPQPIPDGDVGSRQADPLSDTIRWAPVGENSVLYDGERGGQERDEHQQRIAAPQPIPGGDAGSRQAKNPPKSSLRPPAGNPPRANGDGESDHFNGDLHQAGVALADRFSDPIIAEIAETWRQRQDMVRAQQKLTLQAKAILRRFTAGDKSEADNLYIAIAGKGQHPLADAAGAAIFGLLKAQEPLIEQRKAYEKHLGKLAKQLPIADFAKSIKGLGLDGLAKVVGELGDLSAYEKGVAGIWKRAGLAVIDGKRQRKVVGEEAIIHGYSPSRRSVFWNVAASLLKAQGTGDEAGPYRRVYDERKSYELGRGIPKAHAHNRAMRHMTKRLLRELWRAWKVASGGQPRVDLQFMRAAGGAEIPTSVGDGQAIRTSISKTATPARQHVSGGQAAPDPHGRSAAGGDYES